MMIPPPTGCVEEQRLGNGDGARQSRRGGARRTAGAGRRHQVLTFFRGYHPLNLGYHAALVGWTQHADDVALATRREARRLG